MITESQPRAGRMPQTGKSAAEAAVDLLASVKFAVGLIVVIIVACVAGTVLPQGAEANTYVQNNPAAAARFAYFAKLGLTHVFNAPWFIALLCVLASSVMVCSTRRFATVKRASGFAKRRAFGSLLTHLSILLILGGAVARGVWGEKGSVALRAGETIDQFEGDAGPRSLPFALQLAKFEIETDPAVSTAAVTTPETSSTILVQWPERGLQTVIPAVEGTVKDLTPEGETASPANTFHIQVLKYVPAFSVDFATHGVTNRSSEPNNPALLVAVNGPNYQSHRWIFAKFPSFTMHEDGSPITASPLAFVYRNDAAHSAAPAMRRSIKNFRSTVQLVDNGVAVGERTIAVNSPLKVKSYTFYQTGYNPDDLSWTSLRVVRDPGVPFVYAGFILLIGGLFVVFYLNPWLTAREAKA